MRQKDFNEVARLLGNELRTCPVNEEDGLDAAFVALMGHADHAYPDVNLLAMKAAWETGIQAGM